MIALYTETLGNPRRFARIARRVSLRRPIVAVRTGAAGIGPATGALYQQCGLIEVPAVTALLDTARVLVSQPVPAGPRIAVVSNSRSPAVLARAALDTAGLQAVDAPVGLDWTADAFDVGRAVRAALDSDEIDGVMVINAPPVVGAETAVAEQIDLAADGAPKPVVAVVLGGDNGPLRPGSSVPAFVFPEPAAAALGRAASYGRWLRSEAVMISERLDDVDIDAAQVAVEAAVAAGASAMDPETAAELLRFYGVSVPPMRAVMADDAARVAGELGFPVAVKALRREVGRSARAGIALDLRDAESVRSAVATMRTSIGVGAEMVVVQQMVPPGFEVRIHCTSDAALGPVITVGIGGLAADVLADGTSRLAPVSTAAAMTLVESSRVGAALAAAGVAHDALVDQIRRVAQLADDVSAIAEIDLNPVLVSAHGCWATDVAVRVGAPDRDDTAIRRLD